MSREMAKKPVRTIIAIFALMLVGIVLWFAIDGRIQSSRDSRRADELERINTELEANLAESNRIRAEDARIRKEAEGELGRLRETLERTEIYITELRDENNRFRDTIDEFADIRRKLGSETGELEGLAQRIGDGAREALRIVEQLQAESTGRD